MVTALNHFLHYSTLEFSCTKFVSTFLIILNKLLIIVNKFNGREKLQTTSELKSNIYIQYIPQIPHNQFVNIKFIARGGFSRIYMATWKRNTEPYNRENKIQVVLKDIKGHDHFFSNE
ncbi:15504_t:CDS:2 [Gigaspora margarita]|uniref:15504_t:CDS:1 n=1 Tax=Gigaspora margarita TaxID=4874 RepID=A0ABM8W4D5_GIGMA|nr:15504_t:CDS:2 [Gigaspora margarita]